MKIHNLIDLNTVLDHFYGPTKNKFIDSESKNLC